MSNIRDLPPKELEQFILKCYKRQKKQKVRITYPYPRISDLEYRKEFYDQPGGDNHVFYHRKFDVTTWVPLDRYFKEDAVKLAVRCVFRYYRISRMTFAQYRKFMLG